MSCKSCEANADLLVKYTAMKRDHEELLVYICAIQDLVSNDPYSRVGRMTVEAVRELKEKYDTITAEREDVFL